MSAIKTRHIYDCKCHPFCNEKSYFQSTIDNVGNTLIEQCIHAKPYEEKSFTLIGLFNSAEIEALKKVI